MIPPKKSADQTESPDTTTRQNALPRITAVRFSYLGGGKRCAFSSPDPPTFWSSFPVTPQRHWVYQYKVCAVCSTGRAPTVSRSYTAAPGALCRCAVGLCSPTVHPRNFCCSAFALNAQKFIHIRAARSHPCGARTCYSSKPQKTDKNG